MGWSWYFNPRNDPLVGEGELMLPSTAFTASGEVSKNGVEAQSGEHGGQMIPLALEEVMQGSRECCISTGNLHISPLIAGFAVLLT